MNRPKLPDGVDMPLEFTRSLGFNTNNAKLKIIGLSDKDLLNMGKDQEEIDSMRKVKPTNFEPKETILDVAIAIIKNKATKSQLKKWENYCDTDNFLNSLAKKVMTHKGYNVKEPTDIDLLIENYVSWVKSKGLKTIHVFEGMKHRIGYLNDVSIIEVKKHEYL